MAEQILTREAILDTAEQVLRRFGPEKTSLVDIARSLHVSHGTIYRHFASKSALMEAVAERWLLTITEPLDGTFHQECSATTRLRLWMDTLIRIKQTKAHQDRELFSMYASFAKELEAVAQRLMDHLLSNLTRIIEDGISSQEFKDGVPREIATGILIATDRFYHPVHAKEWLSPTIQQEFEIVWNLIMSGVSR